MRYDVAIIGSGPAGLEAAITLKIRNKNIILFGSSIKSEKVEKAHEINNYLGLTAIPGSELAEKFLEHAKSLGIEIKQERITNVYAMGNYYSLQTSSNEMVEATSVIVASGVNFGKTLEGEDKYLGRGVSYCATCDAALYKDKVVTVISTNSKEEEEANFLSEVASKVYYIPLYKMTDSKLLPSIEIIEDQPLEISGVLKANKLILKNKELDCDGIFILRESVPPASLIPGIEMDGSHIKVDINMKTNLKGCFAAGDIAGKPYQYIKSAGQGNIAALSAVDYLNEIKNKQ